MMLEPTKQVDKGQIALSHFPAKNAQSGLACIFLLIQIQSREGYQTQTLGSLLFRPGFVLRNLREVDKHFLSSRRKMTLSEASFGGTECHVICPLPKCLLPVGY